MCGSQVCLCCPQSRGGKPEKEVRNAIKTLVVNFLLFRQLLKRGFGFFWLLHLSSFWADFLVRQGCHNRFIAMKSSICWQGNGKPDIGTGPRCGLKSFVMTTFTFRLKKGTEEQVLCGKADLVDQPDYTLKRQKKIPSIALRIKKASFESWRRRRRRRKKQEQHLGPLLSPLSGYCCWIKANCFCLFLL